MAGRYSSSPDGLPSEQLLRRLWTGMPLAVLALGLSWLALSSFYTVEPHEVAVVLRFGRYQATSPPGLHFKMPLVETVLKTSVEEHSLRLPFAAGPVRPTDASEEQTLMLTGDLNAASVEWTVQWRVTRPEEYLFRFPQIDSEESAERLIRMVAQSVMNQLVGDYSIGEVLTERRADIGNRALAATQAALDAYKCGITISALQMQRVRPPEKVRPAYERVNASIQQRDRLQNEAHKERNEQIPTALARKDQLIREAQGYADRQRALAEGEIAALLARWEAYRQAPDLTRQRLFLETMQRVLGNVEAKIIIDSKLQQVLPLLPLQEGAQP
jgi:membrane protease subunit HflK